jgi:hypothetical protein
LELFDKYGTDEQCREALFDWKFKDGFICPEYGSKLFFKLKSDNCINVIAVTIKRLPHRERFLMELSYY